MTPEPAIRGHLNPEESLLWTAQPVPGHAAWAGLPGQTWPIRMTFFALAALAAAAFSLCGVYLVWAAAQSFIAFDSLAKVLGAPMLLAFGLVFTVAPWALLARPRFRHRASARETWYALTDRRVLVMLVRDGEVVDERATPLHSIEGVEVRFESSDGVGDVVYAAATTADPVASDGWSGARAAGFVAVPDARAVALRVQEAIGKHAGDIIAA